ncbi:MAG: hypothetical protein KatS3mg118_2923 [Paracoccaceae bacterium]|nr:MAG: hypothetical protein KatS3mg118_2923 [Paracoccaceae bacterium]
MGRNGARIGIEGVPDDADGHFLTIRDAAWTGRRRPADLWAVGDVVMVARLKDAEGRTQGWSLRQMPGACRAR